MPKAVWASSVTKMSQHKRLSVCLDGHGGRPDLHQRGPDPRVAPAPAPQQAELVSGRHGVVEGLGQDQSEWAAAGRQVAEVDPASVASARGMVQHLKSRQFGLLPAQHQPRVCDVDGLGDESVVRLIDPQHQRRPLYSDSR